MREAVQPVDDFSVEQGGKDVALPSAFTPDGGPLHLSADDPETADYAVRVDWTATLDPDEAISEKGFFGNQNTVARPRSPSWDHTVTRLKRRFSVE